MPGIANVLSGLLANEERIRALRLGAADYLFAHRPEAVADNYLRALAGVSETEDRWRWRLRVGLAGSVSAGGAAIGVLGATGDNASSAFA